MIMNSMRAGQLAGASAIGVLLAIVPLLGSQPMHSQAATGLQLLAQAERNTNAVKTLSHHDTQTVVSSNSTVAVTLHGAEDEVHNRETDSESVHYSGKNAKGKQQSIQYTLDIVFMNGKTYYRSSLARANKWQTVKGMSLRDPYTGVGWHRARTTVPTIALIAKNIAYHLVGTSGGLTRFQGSFKQKTFAGTDELWVSGGAQPYVMREEQRYHSLTNPHQRVVEIDNFDSFNSPVLISVPTKQAGA